MRLWQKGIVFGALIGFLLTLFKREERQHVLNQSKETVNQVKYIYQHPSQSVHQLRVKLNDVMSGVDQFIYQLDQIEKKMSEKTNKLNQ
ncbi:ABC-type dipeptide/oligopeptide/nickel transport system ATPase subunit [Alkalibacillus filiformis]|uniref:ABC-type dipeptide/oligopeptide/nickel transport system ATPase subunit n=1 Tax=Alkalibacillus filiformis TaxID=200990 RepID=A0ABU0DU41_9BACI|nr:hypothetical protein [Alkalibacillus filiformis]MDQ0351983.1 ABC-type dipeptide/oligopeptide/nickel transport system ATPase subunit [Alkalibacillus filiformis]